MSDELDEFLETANKWNQVRHTVDKRRDAKASGELERIHEETWKYESKSTRLVIGCGIIWAAMIIATIILCVTNNDIVLTALHI